MVLCLNPLKEEASLAGVGIIGIDLAKLSFQLHGVRPQHGWGNTPIPFSTGSPLCNLKNL